MTPPARVYPYEFGPLHTDARLTAKATTLMKKVIRKAIGGAAAIALAGATLAGTMWVTHHPDWQQRTPDRKSALINANHVYDVTVRCESHSRTTDVVGTGTSASYADALRHAKANAGSQLLPGQHPQRCHVINNGP